MKYFALIIFLVIVSHTPLHAQTEVTKTEVGEVYTIQQPTQQDFQHINLPRANFIIKKGGIPNPKSIIGKQVVVSKITTGANGEQKVILKPLDGGKFFRSFPTISANFNQAIESGELK